MFTRLGQAPARPKCAELLPSSEKPASGRRVVAALPALASALALALAACGSSASSSTAPAVSKPASSPAGAAAPASASAAGAGAVPSASVVGQKAPGPYTANGSAAVANGQASIDATDTLKWQPNTLIAKAGDKITLTVKNTGNTAHTILSPALNLNQTDVPIQKTTTVSFTAPSAPGAYQFWCNIPGHAEAGMVGEVIVQ